MMLSQADHRPAHLTRVRDALTALPEPDQARLGVPRTGRPDRTCSPTGRPSAPSAWSQTPWPRTSPTACRRRPSRGSATTCWRHPSPVSSRTPARRWRWTGPTWKPSPGRPSRGTRDCADPEASWGHRSGGGPGQDSELFFGYYASAATMMREEHGPPVPELARRMTVSLLPSRPGPGPGPGAHRDAASRHPARRHPGRLRLRPPRRRRLGHPAARRRGAAGPGPAPLRPRPPGTHHGAIIANGNLYCPATPTTLLELSPLARDATPEQVSAHDQQSAELARHKLGPITSDDADGYHRVMCPAAMGKIRCPLRPASMTLTRDRPEILTPPGHPPACCTQQTITVPADVAAKTRQKHDYPSAAHRKSYARRTGAERTFSTAKDPASNNITRGWTRLTGLHPSRSGSPACSPSATSASSPPGTPARTTTPAAPPPACPPRPAAGAARPSPTWPPRAHHHDTGANPLQPASPQPRHPRPSDPAPKQPGTRTQAQRNRQNPPTTASQPKCQT